MTVRFYRNTDVDAPPLRGANAGDLINLLDKCLVTGYGSKSPAGWSKPYVGTNVAVFRPGAGNRFYLRVADTNSFTTLNYARVWAYESMTDVDTGTNRFPTDEYQPGGLWWYLQFNGTAGNASARNWCVIADERFFYAFWCTNPNADDSAGYGECYCFGDIVAYGGLDAWATILTGKASNTDYNSTGSDNLWVATSMGAGSSNTRQSMARRYDGLGGADNFTAFIVDMGKFTGAASNVNIGAGAISFPNQVDGKMYFTPVEVGDFAVGSVLRGKMPGMIASCHAISTLPLRGAIVDGYDDYAGKQFISYRGGNNGFLIEISDTWRS